MGTRLIIFVLLIAASPVFAGTFPNSYSTKTVPVAADKLLGTDSENSDATVVMTTGSLPVSTPVQTALDLKQGLITLGTPNGLYFEGTILSMYAATNTNAGAATAAQIIELERLGTATPSWVDGQAGAWWATSEINTVDPVTYSSGRIGLAPYGTGFDLCYNGACSDVSIEVASGTAALGTSSISTGTCATVVTVSATGVLTTDVISWSFNSDPSSVTGYNPSGDLVYIVDYPTADNVNFKVCNKSGSSITPGAITLNWRVDR